MPCHCLRNISQAHSFPPVKSPDGPHRTYGEGWTYVAHGTTFAVAVALWALGGVWLDRRLGTMPLFTLIGTVGGMLLAGFWLIQRVKAGERRKR